MSSKNLLETPNNFRLLGRPCQLAILPALMAVAEALELRKAAGHADGDLVRDLDDLNWMVVMRVGAAAGQVSNDELAAEAIELAHEGLIFALRCLALLEQMAEASPGLEELIRGLERIAGRLES